MNDADLYAPLVAMAAPFPTEDDIEFDEYLWSNLYEYGEGDIPMPAEIASITNLAASSPEGWGSKNIALVGELTDGRWVTCAAWADTSGFGCRQQVDWRINPTREAAIAFGLDTEGRAWLGLNPLTPDAPAV